MGQLLLTLERLQLCAQMEHGGLYIVSYTLTRLRNVPPHNSAVLYKYYKHIRLQRIARTHNDYCQKRLYLPFALCPLPRLRLQDRALTQLVYNTATCACARGSTCTITSSMCSTVPCILNLESRKKCRYNVEGETQVSQISLRPTHCQISFSALPLVGLCCSL